jgi:KRAB domain-containing zinc finger protein
MNSDTICRICIKKFQNLHEMYDIFDGEEPIFTLIMRCTSVQISKDDGLPDKICHVCLANLKLVLRFKSQCESSDFYLRELQQNPEEDDDAQKDCEEIQQKRKNNGIYQCPVCPYGTKSNYFMTDHMKSHDSGLEFFNCEDNKLEKYGCNKCNFATDFVVALNEHNKDTHDTPSNRQNNRIQNRKYTVKSYICGKCKFETRSVLQWMRHTRIRCRGRKTHDACWFECSMCSYRSVSALNLKSHKIRRHKHQKPRSSSPRHKCDKCAYKTDHKSHLQSHTIRHHLALEEIQWHKCDKCEYQGKTKACVDKHYRVHHDSSKWIKCNECEFMAKTKDRLKPHLLSKHTPDHEVKWFKCGHCDYRAKFKHNLVNHLTTHHSMKSVNVSRNSK